MPTREGRPYIGSEDFASLWTAGAAWEQAAERISVFKLYGEWVDLATPRQLQAAVQGIAERGMVLAVEAGPLDPPPTCGAGVEGFAGSDSGRRLAQRIRAAGGTLQVIALDEPWYFGHVYSGPNACHLPVEEVARGVAEFVAAVREEFPWVLVGDIEPTPQPVSASGLTEWMDAYEAAVGEPMAFLHLDMDWSQSGWSDLALAVESGGRARDIPVGIIYTGGAAPADGQWIRLAGQRVLDHEDRDGGSPDHVIFQSWNDHPDFVLPETGEYTFTSLVNRYFDDRGSLGLGGPGGNLAWGKPATASTELAGSPASNAVDGDPDRIWNAGAGPVAWIEIDLGALVSVSGLRLYVSQYPAGPVEHRLEGRTSAGGALVPLATISRSTTDYDVLELDGTGWPAIRTLRITTTSSPSWVAWREIEIDGS